MGKSSDSTTWTKIFFSAFAIIILMALFEVGPFKKGESTTNSEQTIYHPQTGKGTAKTISFGGRPVSTCRKFNGTSRNGTYTCTVTVYDSDPNTAYINNSNQGGQIYEAANYDDPGSFYCYWGSVAIYF